MRKKETEREKVKAWLLIVMLAENIFTSSSVKWPAGYWLAKAGGECAAEVKPSAFLSTLSTSSLCSLPPLASLPSLDEDPPPWTTGARWRSGELQAWEAQ